MDQRLADPPLAPLDPVVFGPPPPLRHNPVELVRFMRAHRMLNHRYAALLVRLGWAKLRLGDRLQLDGIAFIRPGVHLEIAPGARLVLGRWSWLGDNSKVRVHEGIAEIGAKSVLGQECTITCFRQIRIGRECIIADKVMMIDFDHGVVDVDRPIRAQGIYKRPVEIGHNCWIGYGASILRGVRVGQNCVIGTNSVVTKDIPDNAVAGGIPARVLRMRKAPRAMRFD
ncbi:MAG TPA: acyltransferase [Solirubrobacteraceae bacterium]|jgi:acetyltransferase-like isoleucine patch superfamily enzyme|nr:acyltransferase [Solirubrobacteraceae bacterium]